MATTHMLAGMSLAIPLFIVAPEVAAIALVAGLIGGLFPDLDLYLHHRRTLHYPVMYPVGTLLALPFALLHPSAWTVAISVGLAAAALHTTMDLFGGGLELRPWEGTSNHGVYSHVHGRWLRPRRWVTYDGSPRDLVLATGMGLPLIAVVDGPIQVLVAGLLIVSATYVLLRKQLADLAVDIAHLLPTTLHRYVPDRYFGADQPSPSPAD